MMQIEENLWKLEILPHIHQRKLFRAKAITGRGMKVYTHVYKGKYKQQKMYIHTQSSLFFF